MHILVLGSNIEKERNYSHILELGSNISAYPTYNVDNWEHKNILTSHIPEVKQWNLKSKLHYQQLLSSAARN